MADTTTLPELDPDEIDLYEPSQYARAVPLDAMAVLRRERPVFWQDIPGHAGTWILLRHDDVMAASADWRTFSAARGGIVAEDATPKQMEASRTQLLSMDPPEHLELRRLILRAFTPAAVRDMEAWLREWSRSVMLEAAERGDCDFVHDVAGQLPMQTINQLMAIPDEDRTKLADWADRVIAGGGGRDRDQPDDPGAELGAYGYRLAEQRRGQGNDDLISLMLEGTYRGEPLDAVGFAGLFVQIAVAGNETTRSMLAGTLLAFEQFPETYRRLSEAGNVPPSAVEEMLRWTTPVHYFRRTATTDTEVQGQRIAEGDKVLLHYTAANHDPEVFVDPGTFDIDRDPNPHLSFGWGEHFCLGARLARLEATVFWEEFFRVFKGFERTGEAVRLPSNLTNTITSIPVRLLPR